MIKIEEKTRDSLIELYNERKIGIEGNILKLIDTKDDPILNKYIDTLIENDIETRRKRLDITRRVQSQNTELVKSKEENERLNRVLIEALKTSENAKHLVESDLEFLQRKTQFELIGTIVRVALGVILGVGVITTVIYVLAMLTNHDTKIIESAWSNMFGILLTNSFSIIGTIMGVKYATDKK